MELGFFFLQNEMNHSLEEKKINSGFLVLLLNYRLRENFQSYLRKPCLQEIKNLPSTMLKINNKTSKSSDYYIQTPNPRVAVLLRYITLKILPAFPLNLCIIATTTKKHSAFLLFILKVQVSLFSFQSLHFLVSLHAYAIHLISLTLLFREFWYYFYPMCSCNFDCVMVSQ